MRVGVITILGMRVSDTSNWRYRFAEDLPRDVFSAFLGIRFQGNKPSERDLQLGQGLHSHIGEGKRL